MTVKFRQVSTFLMKKQLTLFIVLGLFLLFGCGKDKPPTGGPKDTTPPKIIDFEPSHMTTNFDGKELSITFSEPIDPKSFESALYIYPPVLKKKIVAGNQEIRVKFREALKPNQAYLVTIDTRLEDLRDNSLENIYTSTFSTSDSLESGELKVKLILHERVKARPGTYYVQLFDAMDTIFVTARNSDNLSTFSYENLPLQGYIVKGFLDENQNKEPDINRELIDKKEVVLTDASTQVTLALTLQDTTKPFLKSITGISAKKILLRFNEEINKVGSIRIFQAENRERIPIYEYLLDGMEMSCFTSPADTIKYLVELLDLVDYMGNVTKIDTMSFFNFAQPDTSNLVIDSLSHNDGQTVLTLMPEFVVRFNKIIPLDKAKIQLINSETEQSVPLDITKKNGYMIVTCPKNPLKNYVPYKLVVSDETMDYEGNRLEEGIEISILPLMYN